MFDYNFDNFDRAIADDFKKSMKEQLFGEHADFDKTFSRLQNSFGQLYTINTRNLDHFELKSGLYSTPRELNLQIKSIGFGALKSSSSHEEIELALNKFVDKIVKANEKEDRAFVFYNSDTQEIVAKEKGALKTAIDDAKGKEVKVKVSVVDKKAGTSTELEVKEIKADNKAFEAAQNRFFSEMLGDVVATTPMMQQNKASHEEAHHANGHGATKHVATGEERRAGRAKEQREKGKAGQRAERREMQEVEKRQLAKEIAEEAKAEAQKRQAQRKQDAVKAQDKARDLTREAQGFDPTSNK